MGIDQLTTSIINSQSIIDGNVSLYDSWEL